MKNLNFLLFVLLMVTASALTSCWQTQSPAELYDLKVESQINPLGIDRLQPLFSWKTSDSRRGAFQTAYQVLVSSSIQNLSDNNGDIWDSGKVDSSESVQVEFNGLEPQSGKTYFWKVRIWDLEGVNTDWSETASWEMGLLNPSDWQAKWIARSVAKPVSSVYMRSEFTLEQKEIEKARLFVTGLGNYVFYINGNRIGDDLLTPGWTHYPKTLEYQVYNVEDVLQEGENALGAILGSMWWSGGLGWQGGAKYAEGPLKLLAQLQVTFADGETKIFGTDTTWRWQESPVVYDNIYHGETYDANFEISDWCTADYDDTIWAKAEPAQYEGTLSGPRFPALREQMQITPVSLNEPIPGEYVYDLGQNMVGWAQFMVNAPMGDTITLRFAELLHDNGTVAQENLRSAKATDRIIGNGETLVWEPLFTYHGFRYVQVSGLKSKPEQTALIGKVIHTSEPFIGSFECSNKLINNINKNIIWGQRGNFFTVPTDCPQRDERLGWMGDAQIFAPTANFNMQLNRFWEKWMRDIADGQDSAGWVVDVNPPIVVGGPSKPGWGDACVIIPWLTYRYYGNTRIISDNFEVMKRWVNYMESKSNNFIYIWDEAKNGWNGYGDWIAVEKTPSESIGTAYFFYTSHLLSKMANIIGKSDDAVHYSTLAGKIAAAYQQKYWNKETQVYPPNTQTASLLPLAFGITPDELKAQVVINLVANVKEKEVHPTTGFLGTGYILPILTLYNHHELAYKMINQTTYPSWGYMVVKGATSIWELWNSDVERPEGMNSRNHFALGCVGEWMWNNLAGINICDEFPGFKRVIIHPQPAGDLKWAKAKYETNYGTLSVDWKIEGNIFKMNLVIPANTDAVIMQPAFPVGGVMKENGQPLNSGKIKGITIDDKGQVIASAGSYQITVE